MRVLLYQQQPLAPGSYELGVELGQANYDLGMGGMPLSE